MKNSIGSKWIFKTEMLTREAISAGLKIDIVRYFVLNSLPDPVLNKWECAKQEIITIINDVFDRDVKHK